MAWTQGSTAARLPIDFIRAFGALQETGTAGPKGNELKPKLTADECG